MNFNECEEKKLIKKNPFAVNWVKTEIKIAENFIRQAKKILNNDTLDACELTAYNCIFHSARSLLYSKGYVEKSHFCLFIAVAKLYENETELVKLLKEADQFRISRQEISYEGTEATREEVEHIIKFAENILNITKNKIM